MSTFILFVLLVAVKRCKQFTSVGQYHQLVSPWQMRHCCCCWCYDRGSWLGKLPIDARGAGEGGEGRGHGNWRQLCRVLSLGVRGVMTGGGTGLDTGHGYLIFTLTQGWVASRQRSLVMDRNCLVSPQL